MSTKIIADACSNHLGDRRLIEHMIKTAAEIDIDYIKFQTFRADKLNKNWPDYQKEYEYYKSVELSEADHAFILEKCKEHGINAMFTAMDFERAVQLSIWGVKNIKIGSAENDKNDILNYCLSKNFENVFISNGMGQNPACFKELIRSGAKVLYCISKYPTAYEEIDFDKMQLFDGLSDHTQGIESAKKAIDLGMGYIERHFTLGKYLPGKDHAISSTPDEFKKLVEHRDYVEKCKLYKSRWNNG